MASRSNIYDIEQIMYSFQRYRSDHIFDRDSFDKQFEKHFNPELANATINGKKISDQIWKQERIQDVIAKNRALLEREGRLPKFEYTNKELQQAKEIRKWHLVQEKGRTVRAHRVKIIRKGKEVYRYRDSYGRFTSNPKE